MQKFDIYTRGDMTIRMTAAHGKVHVDVNVGRDQIMNILADGAYSNNMDSKILTFVDASGEIIGNVTMHGFRQVA